MRSAGSTPAHELNRAVRRVMDELGIDLPHEVPTKLSTDDGDAADVVVTMGCSDACPVFPGKPRRPGVHRLGLARPLAPVGAAPLTLPAHTSPPH